MPKESGDVRAAFIVRACNAHEGLVAQNEAMRKALESLVALANDSAGSSFTLREVFGTFRHSAQSEGTKSRAALALAKE